MGKYNRQESRSPKLVIFDIDGTLLETSYKFQVLAALQATAEFGVNPPLKFVQQVLIHEPNRVTEFGLTNECAKEYRDRFRILVKDFILNAPQPKRNTALESVLRLKESGRYVGAATSAVGFWMQAALEHMNMTHLMDMAVSRSDLPSEDLAKPNKKQLEMIMDYLGVAPTETVMVGDTWSDIGAARNAGVKRYVHLLHPGNEKFNPWNKYNRDKTLRQQRAFGHHHAVSMALGMQKIR